MQAEPQPVLSCLTDDRLGMKQAMLEIIASRAASTPRDVMRYTKFTLLAATHDVQVRLALSTLARANDSTFFSRLQFKPRSPQLQLPAVVRKNSRASLPSKLPDLRDILGKPVHKAARNLILGDLCL